MSTVSTLFNAGERDWVGNDDDGSNDLAILSDEIYQRIQKARTSVIRLAFVDLFVTSLTGRITSLKKLGSLAQEIGSSLEFQLSEPLLVIRCLESILRRKLLVIGGGHRFLVGARQKHMLMFSYQVVDLSNLMDVGKPLHFKRHSFLLVHHVEVSEPRPDHYGIMAQVAEYGKLRKYWLERESLRIQNIRSSRPSAKPKALTHRKLYKLYTVLYKPGKRRRQHAISFLSSDVEKTRTGYMSGADMLLKADVISDLCYPEGCANTNFSLSSLNTVRSWTIAKIVSTVKSMMASYEENQNVAIKFVNNRKKRPKSTNSSSEHSPTKPATVQASPTIVKPPVGWEHYMDWKAEGNLGFVDDLKQKLEEEDQSVQKEINFTVTVIEDNKGKLQILASVRLRMIAMMKEGHTTFDVAALLTEESSKFPFDTDSTGSLTVTGGVLGDELKLNRRDMKSIVNLRDATDQAVMYTMLFLSNWTLSAINDVFVLDPVFTSGWWDRELVVGTEEYLERQKRVQTHPESRINKHELVWRSKTTFIFMFRSDHWSLAVLFGLPQLLQWMEDSPDFQNSSSATSPTVPRCLIFDSMDKHRSPHAQFTNNLIRYLCCSTPGPALNEEQLLKLLNVHEHRRSLQKGRECGFYVTYHASLVLRNIDMFRTGSVNERRLYLNELYRTFSFSRYSHIIQTRMRIMMFKFDTGGRQAVHSSVFLWDDDAAIVVDSGANRDDADVIFLEQRAIDSPSRRTRSKTKAGAGQVEGKHASPTSCTTVGMTHNKDQEQTEKSNAERGDAKAEDGKVQAVPLKISSEQQDASHFEANESGQSFVHALLDFSIRTSVAMEYREETLKHVLEDPRFKNALDITVGKDTTLKSISRFTPILAPLIQSALLRTTKKHMSVHSANNAYESESSINNKSTPHTTETQPHLSSGNDPMMDVASIVAEGTELMKETEDESIQQEWVKCMEKAKSIIDQARKKRRLN